MFRLEVQQSYAGVADPGWDARLAGLKEDFWMIDERLVAIMQYDDDHRPLEPAEPTEPVETYVAQRDLALRHAVPLGEWVDEHQELLVR